MRPWKPEKQSNWVRRKNNLPPIEKEKEDKEKENGNKT